VPTATPPGGTAFATVADVQDLYEVELPAGAEARVQTLLDYASAIYRRAHPSLGAGLSDGSLDPVLVRLAVVNACLRVIRNPGGVISETAGEFSYRVDSAMAAGRLSFTAEEMSWGRPPRTGAPRTINLMLPLAPPPDTSRYRRWRSP